MIDYAKHIAQYCADITAGRVPSCRWTRKAIERYHYDLMRAKQGKFPFVYLQEEADKLLSFAEALKPVDLNGETLKLLPWQMFVLAQLEGWRHREDSDNKRFRTAYIEVNRKNGKTTGLLEPLVLYNFLKYKASESYIVSSCDTLSEKTFKEVAAMVKADATLDKALKAQSLTITFKDTAEHSRLGFYCDGGKSVDGLRPRFFCLDEYHEYTTDKMLMGMLYGMRTKRDAQGVMITTADTDVSRPCYEQHTKARRILNGTQSQEEFFAIMYALDEGDDWHDRKTWQKANPSMGAFIDESVIASDIQDAELTPHKVGELKAKTFGIWGGGGAHSWIAMEVWQKNAGEKVDWAEFEGAQCFGGLDLAQVDDLCAFTLVFEKDGKRYFKHRFYIPKATVYERYQKENVNFMAWVEQGIITATPGATVDYDFIVRDILQDAERYKIAAIGYDKWQAKDVINAIDEKRSDIELAEVGQGIAVFSPLTKAYEKLIKDGLVVDNNPVMVWMLNNVEVKPDANGNYKPMKSSKASTAHIDGVISSIMAYGISQNEEFAPAAQVDWQTLKALML